MHITEVLLLVVKNNDEGKLRGRTLFQKKVYFLSVLMNVDLGFSPYYYGPYSSYVASQLDSLVNCGLLEEVTESFSNEENIFGEIRRHTYFIPDNFESAWQDIQKRPRFSEWQDALSRINNQKISEDFNKLSIAAKVHYIVDWKKEGTIEEIKQIAKEYRWKVNDEDIESVLFFLEELGLITTDESDDIPF
ncbi:hypothetical protein F4Y59_00565 [Candidatus Poribacteria bacterium]|nr:hypothetical protein [Candidatus Poribacteria bacterium]MXY26643.1 hypothetical protein [Candidatus Poribacteria bacterium]MYK18843.1 hypothetical protein [Candidatus Poribacteria bacterium]